MKKSTKNVIQQLMEENFRPMSEKTKTNLFGASNAIFTEKKFKKWLTLNFNRAIIIDK